MHLRGYKNAKIERMAEHDSYHTLPAERAESMWEVNGGHERFSVSLRKDSCEIIPQIGLDWV